MFVPLKICGKRIHMNVYANKTNVFSMDPFDDWFSFHRTVNKQQKIK